MVTIRFLIGLGVLISMLSFTPLAEVSAQNYVDADIGVVYSDVAASEITAADGLLEGGDGGFHLGVGAYRNNELSNWVYGMKLELEDVAGNLLFSFRVLDLGYKVTPRIKVNGFIGAARWDVATAALGYRLGLGATYRLADRWAFGTDVSYSDSLARDKILPEDANESTSPDIFYDIYQVNVYLKYIF